MIYWVTETIHSSIRDYYKDLSMPQVPRSLRGSVLTCQRGLPAYQRSFPGITLPRELVERHLRIEHWTQMPRGGHFAALKEPELLVEDMRAFFRPLRA